MRVQILFFGATAAITGHRRFELESPDGSPASGLFDKLLAEYPRLVAHKLHFSINQQFATGEEIVHDGDELAIFTAVSGG